MANENGMRNPLAGLFGGKRWYQSLTGLSAALVGITAALEGVGVVQPGTSTILTATTDQIAEVVTSPETLNEVQSLFSKVMFVADKLALFFGLPLGIRKAATAANV